MKGFVPHKFIFRHDEINGGFLSIDRVLDQVVGIRLELIGFDGIICTSSSIQASVSSLEKRQNNLSSIAWVQPWPIPEKRDRIESEIMIMESQNHNKVGVSIGSNLFITLLPGSLGEVKMMNTYFIDWCITFYTRS